MLEYRYRFLQELLDLMREETKSDFYSWKSVRGYIFLNKSIYWNYEKETC